MYISLYLPPFLHLFISTTFFPVQCSFIDETDQTIYNFKIFLSASFLQFLAHAQMPYKFYWFSNVIKIRGE